MQQIREAGSEVCVHGLNHDGRLFSSEEILRTRAKAINQYAEEWGARGFRSPVMYRNFEWYDAFLNAGGAAPYFLILSATF